MAMMLGEEKTIKEYIKEYKNEDISYENLHLKEVLSGNDRFLIINNESIISKYEKSLEKYITEKSFTLQEQIKYYYNPKLLSYDLYETTELWFLLLRLNEMYSVTQFNINPIKIYSPSVMSAIEAILDLEKEAIDINTDEVISSTTGIITNS